MRKKFSWTRWRPFNPIFIPKTEKDFEYLKELEEEAKPFHSRDTREGDIVVQHLRSLKVRVFKIKCPECSLLFKTQDSLAIHISKEHLYGRKAAVKMAKEAEEREVTESLLNPTLYYAVVKPRKILPLPKSVEIDVRVQLDKGTRPPTGKERERHDREMALWREKMKNLEEREETLERLPNGLFMEPGLSKDWWYWVPNVWREEQKKWLLPTEQECLNWKKLEIPKRVLKFLLMMED